MPLLLLGSTSHHAIGKLAEPSRTVLNSSRTGVEKPRPPGVKADRSVRMAWILRFPRRREAGAHLIEIASVTKTFTSANAVLTALSDVSLTVGGQEFVTLVVPPAAESRLPDQRELIDFTEIARVN
jgi:hypothetical protein